MKQPGLQLSLRDSIISELYTSKELEAALAKMDPAELREDLRQEIFTVLCALPEDKLVGMHARKELRYFTAGIMVRMMKSDRSTFYNTHRKYSEEVLKTDVVINLDGKVVYVNSPDELRDQDDDQADTNKKALTQAHHLPEPEPLKVWTEGIEDALASLDPYEADMFRLYTEMGLTCTPVAQATKIPVRAVRFVVRQAREKLQRHIRK